MSTTTAQATFETLRAAIETRDADAILDLVADDAVLVSYDKRNPPSEPATIQGKAGIEQMFRDVYGRDLKHEVRDEVVGDDRISFNEWCEYPDGLRVLASGVFDLRDGKIIRVCVNQTWDE